MMSLLGQMLINLILCAVHCHIGPLHGPAKSRRLMFCCLLVDCSIKDYLCSSYKNTSSLILPLIASYS